MSGNRLSTKDVHAATRMTNSARRSQGQIIVARALWYTKPFGAELRQERLDALRPGEARIKTTHSGISRGTERLVASGAIPPSEWDRMRAPNQLGEFPFPIKYGYSAVGEVTAGPEDWLGRIVFCLHPHQDYFHVGLNTLIPLPDGIPAPRATLAANMETALNAHWDAGTGIGDKVLVIGAGVVGLLVAHLAQRVAGTRVVITDIDAGKAAIARDLGLDLVAPGATPRDNDIVFHATATASGLDTAIQSAAREARIIELSWYGSEPVSINLGGTFHSQRLRLISSQVGQVGGTRQRNTTHRERLVQAIGLLDDPRLDRLVENQIDFNQLAERIGEILSSQTGLPRVVRYPID